MELKPAWDKMNQMIPAVVQHHQTLQVLMVGYMSPESFSATLEKEKVVFYSRSKGRLWMKGETSGHTLNLKNWRLDCDQDCFLIFADPQGPTCHLGSQSCFGDTGDVGLGTLARLADVITQRLQDADSESSYTAKLAARGVNKVAQKVGEEGVEVALAGVAESDEALANESADLLYHLLLLLEFRGVPLENVLHVLRQRSQPK